MGITLKEFLKTNDKEDIAILMFDKGGRMVSQEYIQEITDKIFNTLEEIV